MIKIIIKKEEKKTKPYKSEMVKQHSKKIDFTNPVISSLLPVKMRFSEFNAP